MSNVSQIVPSSFRRVWVTRELSLDVCQGANEQGNLEARWAGSK